MLVDTSIWVEHLRHRQLGLVSLSSSRRRVVQGKLKGSIQASYRVDLKQSAVVTGDIATRRISIDEGAYFKGGVNIQKEVPKKEASRVTASPST